MEVPGMMERVIWGEIIQIGSSDSEWRRTSRAKETAEMSSGGENLNKENKEPVSNKETQLG